MKTLAISLLVLVLAAPGRADDGEEDARGQRSDEPTMVLTSRALGGGQAAGGQRPSGGGPLVVYESYKAAPKWTGNGVHIYADFDRGGPGMTLAIGFKTSLEGLWSFVEASGEGTDNCNYTAWISKTPGGQPLGKNCSIQTGWTGGNVRFASTMANKVAATYTCKIDASKKFYFNLRLDRWGPNPHAGNVRSCKEHLIPQGYAAAEILLQ